MGKGKKTEAPVSGSAQQCKCTGCTKNEMRFTFCEEHYEWFKFGLITKEGKKVGDFDRKSEHYQSYQEKQKSYKVA